MSARGGRAMRLRGLVRKEFLQIVRDPSSIAIAFVLPVALLLLFGYGLSLDVDHVPVALVIEQPSADAADLAASFEGSRYFSPRRMPDMGAATKALLAGSVDAIVHLRGDFAARERSASGAAVQVIVNGVDANTARLVEGYLDSALATWLAQRAAAQGLDPPIPVDVEHRVWFNPDLRSRDFLVPGLVVVIMTLTGALLTAMVMAREWERGTMEALLVTPVAAGEILVGKLVPYFALGIGGMLLSVAMARWLFGVPLVGSFWLLLATSSVFLLVALGMGLLISSVAKSQYVAGQVALITTFLPAFLLSGMIFEIGNMPWVVRVITHLFAARYFVAIVTTLFLAGDIWSVVVPNTLALALMALIFFGLTWRRARKRLE
ncbi:MAG TPA: ABC transporter permease [Burkholderiales bacterium]|nr:ABC transporter permease [Burkholderiales bacterium]